jgi:predicted esterase
LFSGIDQSKELIVSLKRMTLLVSAILLCFLSARASEKIVKESFVSHGKSHTYYLFVPANLAPTSPVPMILMFHGTGRNGLSMVEQWADLAAKEGIILVGPDAQDYQGWGGIAEDANFLRELVETLEAKYPINPRRIYLFGHSAGAVFALGFSMLQSEYFAAVAVHAGSWRNDNELEFINYARRKVPLAIFVGDSDPFFPLIAVKATNDALRSRGFPIEVTIIKGHNHNYYDLAPDINRFAWEFLKTHELVSDPKYAAYYSPKAPKATNKDIGEMNELLAAANDLGQRFNVKEEELKKKDYVKDKDVIARIAREEISLLTESEGVHRQAVLVAEGLIKKNPKGIYNQYFSLIAQLERNRIESVQTMREYAEFLLSDQPQNTITIKRNQAVLKAERLQQEADDLEKQAERLRAAYQNREP